MRYSCNHTRFQIVPLLCFPVGILPLRLLLAGTLLRRSNCQRNGARCLCLGFLDCCIDCSIYCTIPIMAGNGITSLTSSFDDLARDECFSIVGQFVFDSCAAVEPTNV